MAGITIRDTGRARADMDRSVRYTRVREGEAIQLHSGYVQYEYGTQIDQQDTLRYNEDKTEIRPNDSKVSALISPRITIRAFFEVNEYGKLDEDVHDIFRMHQTRGLKKVGGGMVMISSSPNRDKSDDEMWCIFKNVTITENLEEGSNIVKMTIQLEQVMPDE